MNSSRAPFPPDLEARRAAADPRRNVVLRASAGTGKTTVLTDRYVALVEAGTPPRNILALTFTRKAAQEMKDRIVGELGKAHRRQALAGRTDIAEVNISTLDAFTLGLIREFPLDAGVSPGVEVLDERSMPVVREEAIRRVLSGVTGFDRDVLGSLPLLLGRSRGEVVKAVRSYLDRRLTWRRYFEEKAAAEDRQPTSPPCLRTFFGEIAPACERLREAALDGLPGLEMPLQMPLAVRLALRLEEQESSRDALDREALESYFSIRRKNPPRGFPGELKEDYVAVAGRVKAFRSLWLDFLNERAFDPVWRLFRAVEAEYQRLKQDRGVMDFDDLTLAATHLLSRLGEFSASRFRLEARYHHLLLDEFHDTSDHQWDLLRAVIAPWAAGMGLAAEEVQRVTAGRLSRPTIFVVGDHKQSIYRFRDARVEILQRAEREIGSLAAPDDTASPRVVLRWNFRSHHLLRRFVNRASHRIAESSEADRDADWAFRYDEDDLLPEAPGPEEERRSERSALAVGVAASHEDVAARLARRIAALVQEDRVEPEQIALLARAGTRLPIYRTAVEELGIPTYLLKGADFFETSEIRDLRALCRYLARPHSDRRAVELLRSRFFALPGDDFVRLRRARGSPTPFSDLLRCGAQELPPSLGSDRAERLQRAGDRVAPWVRLARRLPPSRTVARILEETQYVRRAEAAAGNGYEARQQSANVAKGLQLVRSFERGGFTGFERIAERLAEAADGDATQAAVQAKGAVQALSIHAAKGLEFDHVFVVDCGGRGGRNTGIPRVVESEPGVWNIALVADATAWQIKDGGRAESEERRCMYVAMTRARETLTLSWKTRFTKDGTPDGRDRPRYLPTGFTTAAALAAKQRRASFPWEEHVIEVLPPVAADAEATPGA